MATIYVIHASGDTPFVKQCVLRQLPSNGYDFWLARQHFTDVKPEEEAIAHSMDQCRAILIVLSPEIFGALTSLEEIDISLAGRRTLIVIQTTTLNEQEAAQLPARLWALPKVDFTIEKEEEGLRLLLDLLPPVDGETETIPPKDAEHIEWNEEIFSTALACATDRHDHARIDALVAAIVGHLAHRPYSYPSQCVASIGLPSIEMMARVPIFSTSLTYIPASASFLLFFCRCSSSHDSYRWSSQSNGLICSSPRTVSSTRTSSVSILPPLGRSS